MKGYILRWNPNISSWTYDRHIELMKELEEDSVEMNWSIYDFEDLEDMIKSRYSGDGIYVKYVDGGGYVEFQKGDFFILQQVGTETDGIAMIGTFSSDPYTETSWKKKDGTNLFYADMDIDFMMNRKNMNQEASENKSITLSAEDLSKKFPEIDWHKGHSGVLIPEDRLEPLVLEMCLKYFRLGYEYYILHKIKNEDEAFTSFENLLQRGCDYINYFCPKMRERIINESADRMIYENYTKGETIDKDLLDITFEADNFNCGVPDIDSFLKFLIPRA